MCFAAVITDRQVRCGEEEVVVVVDVRQPLLLPEDLKRHMQPNVQYILGCMRR